MSATIQIRRGTAAAWTGTNPVLALGERGIETDTLLEKSGDGSTAWNSLAYFIQPASTTPIVDGTGAVGTSKLYARQDHVHPTDTSRAPSASPTFTGTPLAPTASLGTNTTQIATTAFVLANAGSSFPAVVASGDLTAQSAAVSSVATFTPSATSTIRISAYLNITSVVTDVIVITVTYKDENTTSQSISSSSISAVGNNSFDLVIRASANAIVVKTTLTTGIGSIAYDVGAIIERLS